MNESEQLEQAIAHLEQQRPLLGDAVVDASIAALRERLAALDIPAIPAVHAPHTIAETQQRRKHLTVLLADVQSSTPMAERMDAEDVTEIMNALWERVEKVIIQHGGTIGKHMGDAVMALWGAETAREDDPERAIRAALAIQAQMAAFRHDRRVDLAMRIGLNTGPVLLGEVGITAEFTAMGDTVNTASRLEHSAPVGGILISHDTYCHVRGIFDVQPQEPLQVKGKAQSLQAYLVQQAKPRAFRMDTRGVEGIETRMIGREEELARLKNALYAALDGERQMITISGDTRSFPMWLPIGRSFKNSRKFRPTNS